MADHKTDKTDKNDLLLDTQFVKSTIMLLRKLTVREPVLELAELQALVYCRERLEKELTSPSESKLNYRHVEIFLRRITAMLPIIDASDQLALAQARMTLENLTTVSVSNSQ
jgi:hypothetical protein